MPRLQILYRDTVVKQLMEQFGYKTAMQVPRIEKIVLNMGVGEAVADKKIMDNAVADMTKIAGQKPIVTKSRKSIANFKIRSGYPIGCKVTLRGRRMYEFLDRLVSIAMPRIRDFRGISARAFDGRGNYNMGVKEQIIFPEIEYDKIDAIRGMNITITTTAKIGQRGEGAARRPSVSRSGTRSTRGNHFMAKTAVINRDKKRREIVKKYAARRKELLADRGQHRSSRPRNATRRARSCRSCRATRPRCGSGTAAR